MSRDRRVVLSAVCALAVAVASTMLSAQDAPAILVSRQLLTAEGLRIGDVVELSADASGARGRPFLIAGVYEPVANPALLGARRLEVRLHLPDMLALTADPANPLDLHGAESVSAINVALEDPAAADAFGNELAGRIPGIVTRAAAGNTAAFLVLQRFHLAIAVVTMIASSVFLLALMVMLVDERREVVGMLRLIGFKRRRILLQVLLEGLIIASGGAVFGTLFAATLEHAVNRFFQWRYDTVLVFVHITPHVAWQSVALAVPLGMIASMLASWTLLRRQAYALARR